MKQSARVIPLVRCPKQRSIIEQRQRSHELSPGYQKTDAVARLEAEIHALMQDPPSEADWVMRALCDQPLTLQCRHVNGRPVWIVSATDCPTLTAGLFADTWHGASPAEAIRLAMASREAIPDAAFVHHDA